MKVTARYVVLVLVLATVAGCNTSRKEVLASGSQVEVRSYQTRTYDTDNKIRVLRAVMATLQDLGFVIDKADDVIGIVSATKLQGYALSMSISVRPNGQQMTVRANAQYNLTAVEDPGPYQDFFTSLDKGLFLDDNLYADSVPTQTSAETSSAGSMSTQASGVTDYYGEAEQEITDHTYNKNLWARAYVEVEGDEQKRKAKYIELRANQLYLANARSKPVVSQTIRPVVDSQAAVQQKSAIAGTYLSEITGSHKSRSNFRIMQEGNNISGISADEKWEIEGTLEGDTIKFAWYGPTNSGKGKFTVDSDGNWIGKYTGGYGSGDWTLTKSR